jgi:hypothetical protein
MGSCDRTSSTNRAALSAPRLAPQLRQKPHRSPHGPTDGTDERNQPLMVAGTDLYAQESMRQPATFEVLIEFLLYVLR